MDDDATTDGQRLQHTTLIHPESGKTMVKTEEIDLEEISGSLEQVKREPRNTGGGGWG